MAQVRNDLDGLRIKLPGAPAVYLMDEGKKRHIPNPVVYNEIFKDWENIIEDLNIDLIETGEPLPETVFLFRCYNSPKVFLVDGIPPNQVKRHIVSPAVMDRYNFDWRKIHIFNVPLDMIALPDGNPIKNP